ncbi:guanylate kinase [Paludibacter sp. 221]|uniref:guanylate kinase n=1 Tax=Paludibacter sp. 221 TaxID=2302939 RepID=UPI0013CF98F3|nr:guanylate kinase [Paludibacter sp. 221]
MSGKLIIFSAPSGAGKSTLVKHLLTKEFNLEFSISATSRAPRGAEQHGCDYYFLSADEFRSKIQQNEFLEYEEVYSDLYYGTLRSEVDRIIGQNKNVVFDVDVVGGLNIKKQYADKALAIFIAPPSVSALEERLKGRATDSPEKIAERINKAEYEMTFAPQFDQIIVNDDLEQAKTEAENVIREFLLKN